MGVVAGGQGVVSEGESLVALRRGRWEGWRIPWKREQGASVQNQHLVLRYAYLGGRQSGMT